MNERPMEDTLLVSDVDGTLITAGFEMPRRNIDALRRFTAAGGHFALATGRSAASAAPYAAKAGVNTPSVILNGSVIYDFTARRALWQTHLPPAVRSLMAEVTRRFPEVGAEMFVDGELFIVRDNAWTRRHTRDEKLGYTLTGLDEVPAEWNKALFAGENALLLEVQKVCESLPHPGWEYVFSGRMYYEMLPTGVTKGTTAEKLAQLCGIRHNRIVAIGDYFNDLDMVARAAFSAVPAGAPDELRRAADITVCPCEEGAVGGFVEYLETHHPADIGR